VVDINYYCMSYKHTHTHTHTHIYVYEMLCCLEFDHMIEDLMSII
jgi:hypothetical protein